ncbi:MAG TPA: hypothetical protein GXX35_05530 [Thermoanaerobacterales bacterium]|nr:hypothetical protein [Thermoanaerobacterales bacterium]
MRNWYKNFLDDISGVLFAPSATLNKIAREKKILQAVIILILSGLLPDIAAFRHVMNENILRSFAMRDFLPGMDGAAFYMARALPYIVALIIIGSIIIIPLLHFIFTAIVELACQFLAQDRAKKAPPDTSGKAPEQNTAGGTQTGETLEINQAAVEGSAEAQSSSQHVATNGKNICTEGSNKNQSQARGEIHASIPSGTGVGLFASMAFATFPMILMVPVNLISTLTEINLTILFGVMLRLWVVVLQVIAVRETHAFTTGRAALAYFALPLLGIAFALVMIIVLLTMAAPLIPHMI